MARSAGRRKDTIETRSEMPIALTCLACLLHALTLQVRRLASSAHTPLPSSYHLTPDRPIPVPSRRFDHRSIIAPCPTPPSNIAPRHCRRPPPPSNVVIAPHLRNITPLFRRGQRCVCGESVRWWPACIVLLLSQKGGLRKGEKGQD
jgi:hypothetical protein